MVTKEDLSTFTRKVNEPREMLVIYKCKENEGYDNVKSQSTM